MLKLFGLACLLWGAVSASDLLPFLHLPRYDGVQRVCRLTAENYTATVTSAGITIVLFSSGQQTLRPACPSNVDNFAELTAQVLKKRNIVVCTARIDESAQQQQSASGTQPKVGDVYVYKGGRQFAYHGKRSPPALISFLQKVNSTQVHVISGKVEKIAFDSVQQPKVVGLFAQGSLDYKAFEDAAALFSPDVPFYAVFDRTVARHLRLDVFGQIHLVRPFEKIPVVCPVNPATLMDIENLVNSYKGVVLTKLTEHNLHDPKILDPTRTLILAIAEQSSPFGGYFYHLLVKLLRFNAHNPDLNKLNIVWVEPASFPAVYIMMDQLESTFGIPNKLPAFGTIDLTTKQSAWFNTALLNPVADRLADDQNIRALMDWLIGVINRTIQPVKLGIQQFSQSPMPQLVAEGSDVVLECVVENPVGDCLWLKDGRNIGFNLARYPHYSWRGDVMAGDCSLQLSGVLRGRDDGQWVCEMTGDLENPTLTSMPVTLTIVASPSNVQPGVTKAEL